MDECTGMKNCGYWYADEGDEYPRCHCEEPVAPCEFDEDDYDCDDPYDEMGFDPYMGCYTDDC